MNPSQERLPLAKIHSLKFPSEIVLKNQLSDLKLDLDLEQAKQKRFNKKRKAKFSNLKLARAKTSIADFINENQKPKKEKKAKLG